jgi:thiaminase/transcriptional activator TenA
MAFTDELLKAVRPLWDAQLGHPFVAGIGDGSLEVARFKRWVRQDYLYLKEYARLFAWAVAKADRLESMGWYASVLHLTLNTEMGLHRAYAERFGIPAQELEAEPMWPTNRAYTDFLIRTAADGDLADLVAALLPCAWGYVYVAQHLAKGRTPEDPRYADWIAQYVSEEFGGLAQGRDEPARGGHQRGQAQAAHGDLPPVEPLRVAVLGDVLEGRGVAGVVPYGGYNSRLPRT